MRVKGYEIDRMFQKSCGYDNITDMMKGLREELTYKKYKGELHRGSLNLYVERKNNFIKENNIIVLKYKGTEQWGDFIYDNLLELNDFIDSNYITRLEDFNTEIPKTLLSKIREMKVVQKINGQYKWVGSKNYQAITINLLKYYES